MIRILIFYPSRIPDPGVKKTPDPEHCLQTRWGIGKTYFEEEKNTFSRKRVSKSNSGRLTVYEKTKPEIK